MIAIVTPYNCMNISGRSSSTSTIRSAGAFSRLAASHMASVLGVSTSPLKREPLKRSNGPSAGILFVRGAPLGVSLTGSSRKRMGLSVYQIITGFL
jgi:hypothetical protein